MLSVSIAHFQSQCTESHLIMIRGQVCQCSDTDSVIKWQIFHSTYPTQGLHSCVIYAKSSKNGSNDLHAATGKKN